MTLEKVKAQLTTFNEATLIPITQKKTIKADKLEIKQEVIEYLFGSNNALMIQYRHGLVTVEFFKLPLRNTMFKSS